MSEKIRVLVVDDEPPARRKIRTFLKGDRSFEVVGEADSGRAAIEAIKNSSPDLVFLDVQMPEIDGFGVLDALSADALPQIVFVTAYDDYALKAFEVAAIDYLLKPFDAERFRRATERAKQRLREQTPDLVDKMRSLMEQVRRKNSSARHILVKGRDRSRMLRTEDISSIQAAGNYVEIFIAGSSHLMRETLDGIAERLDPDTFVRVHRSHLVNADHIREIQPISHGDHCIVLDDGRQIRMSRRYRDRLPASLLRDL